MPPVYRPISTYFIDHLTRDESVCSRSAGTVNFLSAKPLATLRQMLATVGVYFLHISSGYVLCASCTTLWPWPRFYLSQCLFELHSGVGSIAVPPGQYFLWRVGFCLLSLSGWTAWQQLQRLPWSVLVMVVVR